MTNNSASLDKEFLEITPDTYKHVPVNELDEFMKNLTMTARGNGVFMRLTLPVKMFRRDEDRLIKEMSDDELSAYRTKVPDTCVASRSDIILVKDSTGQVATIKDRRTSGYQIIRH